MALDNRYEYRDGHLVSQRVSQVVAAIQEYAPEVEVQWVPPAQRDNDTAAFRLVHHPKDREPYVIFHVKNEDEFDARILKRLMMGDQRNGPLTIGEIEASEAAAAAVARLEAHPRSRGPARAASRDRAPRRRRDTWRRWPRPPSAGRRRPAWASLPRR